MDYYKNIRFNKSIFVELQMPSTITAGTQITFKDVPQLRDKYVQAIESYSAGQVTKTPTNNTVVASVDTVNVLMTFMQKDEERFQNLPYYTMISSLNGGLIREFKNLLININKSYMYAGATGTLASTSLAFTFYYSDQPVN